MQPSPIFGTKNHPCPLVVVIYLPKQFAAATTWRQDDALLVNCDNHLDGGLSRLEHFRDGGVLGTETETTSGFHTYPCEDT